MGVPYFSYKSWQFRFTGWGFVMNPTGCHPSFFQFPAYIFKSVAIQTSRWVRDWVLSFLKNVLGFCGTLNCHPEKWLLHQQTSSNIWMRIFLCIFVFLPNRELVTVFIPTFVSVNVEIGFSSGSHLYLFDSN